MPGVTELSALPAVRPGIEEGCAAVAVSMLLSAIESALVVSVSMQPSWASSESFGVAPSSDTGISDADSWGVRRWVEERSGHRI